MTTIHIAGRERVAYVKGAAEVILAKASLSSEIRAQAERAAAAMEADALRVLALARRVLPRSASSQPRRSSRTSSCSGSSG